MKAKHHTSISIILAICLSFFTSFCGLSLNVLSDDMSSESFRQDLSIDLQYDLLIENDNEFEKDAPDYGLSTCFCLKTNHLHNTETYLLSKNYIFVKQILLSGKFSRSPPLT